VLPYSAATLVAPGATALAVAALLHPTAPCCCGAYRVLGCTASMAYRVLGGAALQSAAANYGAVLLAFCTRYCTPQAPIRPISDLCFHFLQADKKNFWNFFSQKSFF